MTEFNSTLEAINASLDRLEVQGRKAVTLTGSCRYINDKGDKCAVGIVAPDDMLSEQGFCKRQKAIQNHDGRLNRIVPDGQENWQVWRALQDFHDSQWQPEIQKSIREQLQEASKRRPIKFKKLYLFLNEGQNAE